MTVTYPTWVVETEAIMIMVFTGLLMIYYLLRIIEFFVSKRRAKAFKAMLRAKNLKVRDVVDYTRRD